MRQTIQAAIFLLVAAIALAAEDTPQPPEAPTLKDEIARLKSMLAAQQEQINELRSLVQSQQRLIEQILPRTGASRVSATAAGLAPSSTAQSGAVAGAPTLKDSAPAKSSLSLTIGGLRLTPTGFFDFSQVWRSKTVTSGLPTDFAAVPFNNTVFGNRRQTLSSAANSRIGLQMDTRVLGFDVLGVVEADFLGYQPGNLTTNANSYGLRLRLAYADLRKANWEFLGGQAWSLLTPARKGISPLPATLFLTQDLDPNIQSGFVWARAPQVRAVYHAADGVAMGVSFESGDTYGGGSGGAGAVVLPTALAPNYFGQIDTGSGGSAVPSPNTDLVAKIAFDPKTGGRSIHFEVAGLMSRFAFFNPLNNLHFGIAGGAVELNAGIEAVRNLILLTNNFYGNGNGNFIFGEAPNLIITSEGAPSLIPAGSTVDGVEWQPARNWKLWAYFYCVINNNSEL